MLLLAFPPLESAGVMPNGKTFKTPLEMKLLLLELYKDDIAKNFVEQMFAFPGLGMHFIQAATQRDYTLAMGLVLLYTTLLYTMNFLVDISYSLLDPRVKLE